MAQELEHAMNLHRAGRFAEVEPLYRRMLQQQPSNPQLLHLLGIVLTQTGRAGEGVIHLRAAAQLAPQSSHVQFALAQAARLSGHLAEAQLAAQRSIALNPQFPPAHNELGLALANQGNLSAAATAWRSAVQLRADYAEAYSNLGAALAQLEQLDEAIAALKKAVALAPASATAHNNLAGALDETDHVEEAIAHYRKAVELQPDFFDALLNLAKATHARGNDAEALSLIQRALRVNSNNPQARFIRGILLLARGELREGFAEYEFRKLATDFDIKGRQFSLPQWDGGEIAGKRILLHAEQGLGDTIQFARYAPLLAERGADVIIESPPPLTELLKSVPKVHEVISLGGALPPFDVHASVVSLPLLFATTLETIPANVPYVFASSARVERWAQILGPGDGTRRIGLALAGNPSHSNDRNRSISAREFAALAEVTGVTWVSLQKRREPAVDPWLEAKLPIIDHTDALADFADTAALISHLDLVITVDTSVAHLAGAMAKPVWTLLPLMADWRWLRERGDTPWYPTMRLFRQNAQGSWPSVIRSVAAALAQSA